MKIRRLASAVLTTAIRHTSPRVREWGNAMLREMDFIENDWAALFWALGSATALFKKLEAPMSEPSDIFSKTQALLRTIHRRTVVGGVACFIGVLSFGSFVFIFRSTLLQIGASLTVLATLYFAYQLYERHGGKLPSDASSPAIRDFYQEELERQRDFHRGIWFWSRLVTLVPGYFLFCMGAARAHPEVAWVMVADMVCFIVLCILAVRLNLRCSRKYQRQIDELNSLAKES
jgi:hypothetical protein